MTTGPSFHRVLAGIRSPEETILTMVLAILGGMHLVVFQHRECDEELASGGLLKARRVLRRPGSNSSCPFLEMRQKRLNNRLTKQSLRRILKEVRSGLVPLGIAKKANEKLERAGKEMRDPSKQREERKERKRPMHTRELWCEINTEALDRIARGASEAAKGKESGEGEEEERNARESWSTTVQEDAIELSQRVVREANGVGRIRLAYHYSEKGRDLFEAGHITGSREYVTGADPFRWPEYLKSRVLGGRGAEGDDASAFPKARRAMIPGGKGVSERMLKWKPEIMRIGGEHLFPGMDKKKQKKLMKGVINGFDMDSGLDAWKKKKGADSSKTLKGYKIEVGDGHFSLEEYRQEQAQSTMWMATHSESMVEYLRSRVDEGTRAWRKAPLTVKSYLLQEAESTSRLAKVRWCEGRGIRVMSLQHDGIMVKVEKDRYEEIRDGMSQSASVACGYEVEVVVKETVEIDPPVKEESEEEWLERNTLRAQGGNESEDEELAEMLREVHSGKFDYMVENETTGE